MAQVIIFLLVMSIAPLSASLNCNSNQSRYQYSLKKTIEKNPTMKNSNA